MMLKTMRITGWGRVLAAEGQIARPDRAEPGGWPRGPAIGGLRAYGDAALNGAGPSVLMTRLDRCLDFDPETGRLRAEAGVTLSELLRIFAPRGFLPPVMPGTAHATLGGAIAADVHGKNHLGAGSFGLHVTALELADPDGRPTRIDAKSAPDLFRATLGGMGLTGPIITAELTLSRVSGGEMDVSERRIPDLDAFLAAFGETDAPYSVGWIDATASGGQLGRGILETARSVEGSPFAARGAPRKVPFDAPGFLLSAPVVRGFNAVYLSRVPKAGRTRRRPLEAFFFPLDSLAEWNRLYGAGGFHQFQCVVPTAAASKTLGTVLSRVAEAGLLSPLVVLKRLGSGRAGPLSFPMEGYTLAIDIPNRRGAADLVRRLCRDAVEGGGRIYFAKDALCPPDLIPEMYPELPAFRETVHRVDPQGVFETDLSRRLGLRG
ncbi:MAG: FAD-binding oxidoreductase [Pseudomonadota bacterium]